MQMKNSFLENLEFAQDINKLQIPIVVKQIYDNHTLMK